VTRESSTIQQNKKVASVVRTFNLPRDQLFELWVQPEHARHWYGPHGFTVPYCEIDARQGGAYRLCMRGPDGRECWEKGIYREFDAPQRIVTECSVTYGGESVDGISSEIVFEDQGEHTKVTVTMAYSDVDFTKGAEEGWNQTLDRLASYIPDAQQGLASGQLAILRRLDAPLDMVWQAWTDPQLARQWFCPEYCEPVSYEADIRVGGRYQETMQCGDTQHTMQGVYREIIEHVRIVFTHQWTDHDAPETVVTVTFRKLDDQRTELNLYQTGLLTHEAAKRHEEGWSSCIVNLAKTLEIASGAQSLEEIEIRELLDDWSRAMENKDLDGMVALYTPDIVQFDVKPPYRMDGPEPIRESWASCLPYFPKKFEVLRHSHTVRVRGDMAVAHYLFKFRPIDEESRAGDSWYRVTVCLERVNGTWQVFHEHLSAPFDPMTDKVVKITEP
jgi:uncharacterized protein (TIGR02246 family)